MTALLHTLAVLAGVGLVGGTVMSAVRSTVLPRSAHRGLSRATLRGTRWVLGLTVGRSGSYEQRDRVMALLGPLSLLALLAAWLILTLVGFGLIYLGTGIGSVDRAVELSGSSVFTLGTTAAHRIGVDLLTYVEAAIGLLLVTLLITYLPSIYGAFSRRENGVHLLRVRAGDPPRAAALLIRYWIIDDTHERLSDLWQMWEGWFADVEETHTTFAVLPFFRSPRPQESWITAAGALLDAASLWMAAVDHDADPYAALCVRSGFQTLRRIAEMFRIPFDEDPNPSDPISITRDEWEAAVTEMANAGLPVKPDGEQAWRAFRGWRVNYDTVLLSLARTLEARPDVPWISDRSPVWLQGRPARRFLGRIR